MRASVIAGLVLALVAHAAAAGSPKSKDEAGLELLKSLEGSWYGSPVEDPNTPAVTYRVTAGGSTVVETLFPGQPHEMVTMYSLDGGKLVLTHYCAAGNQPVMQLAPGSSETSLHFTFVRGGNMKSRKDGHMDEALISLQGERLRSEWTYSEGGKKGDTKVFDLTRH